MLKITKVKRNSIGKELGLEVGDCITQFDGLPCEDELDYTYYVESERFTMTVKDHRTGEETDVDVEKDEGEDLGLEFEQNTCLRTCHNRCLFCFVDQMPKGMRESLYVKDDDYSMSFTCGNFVTLTNLSSEGLARIVRLQLSPLYVSVHTMNPELRVKLLRNRFAGKIVEQIKTLVEGGIQMHCQAVIVPNENDGDEFKRTARELFAYYPAVKDLACVPTGLTKYRDGLHPIPDVDKAYSEKFLDIVDELNAEFGVNFVVPADEYFVKAERPFKDTAFYGDFAQIENGVGMSAKFFEEANEALDRLQANPKKPLKNRKVLLVCGTSAGKVMPPLVERCNQVIRGLQAELLPVKNKFFGETVTCTGLLTGQDIIEAVLDYEQQFGKVDAIVLPKDVLKEFDDVFLCGTSLSQMKEQLKGTQVFVNKENGYGLVALLAERIGKK